MTANDSSYRREDMPETPGRREIAVVAGEPGPIRRRGADIEALGLAMQQASSTLELIADGAVGRGKSFEALRGQAKDVYADLRVAGERYHPSGSVLVDYATALTTVQLATDRLVANAEDAWAEVNEASLALQGATDDLSAWEHANRDEPEAAGAPSTSGEQARFDEAVAAFETYRLGYDAPVESWEGAYSAARDGLSQVNEDGVEDGFWDDAMPFIEGLLVVLTVLGIVLLIAAFVLTGPLALIAGALAVVVGVLTVLGEVAKFQAGRGSWASLGLALLSIVPFGRLAGLARTADFAADGARFVRVSGATRLLGQEFVEAAGALRNLNAFTLQRLGLGAWGNHGLRSQAMMNGIFSGPFFASTTGTVSSIRQGWLQVASLPPGGAATLPQALGGVAQAYTRGLAGLVGAGGLVGD